MGAGARLPGGVSLVTLRRVAGPAAVPACVGELPWGPVCPAARVLWVLPSRVRPPGPSLPLPPCGAVACLPLPCAEPCTACVVPGQPRSPTPLPHQPSCTLLIPMRGSPTSWGLLQFFLWPCQRVCGKGLEVLLSPSQTVRSLIALSDPACLDSAVSTSVLLLLPHNEGCWVLFDLLSFLIPQYEG